MNLTHDTTIVDRKATLEELGAHLRQKRRLRLYGPTEFAELTGLRLMTISSIEKGHTCPMIKTLRRYLVGLGWNGRPETVTDYVPAHLLKPLAVLQDSARGERNRKGR